MARSRIFSTSCVSAAERLRTAFQISLIPSMVEQRGGCHAPHVTLFSSQAHRFSGRFRIYPHQKTTPGPAKEPQKHSRTSRRAERGLGKNPNKPTSSLINMRSADTHQPKSTIFAHLLGLPCSLLPTKERNKYTTDPKT